MIDSVSTCTLKRLKMKIKEVTDQVTDYDVYKQGHPNSPADVWQDERKSNIFNTDIIYPDMSQSIPRLQTREKRVDLLITKPIPAEFKSFGIELLNKSKDNCIAKTEAVQKANRRPDLIELQHSSTKSTLSLQSSIPELTDLRSSYYIDLFKADRDMKLASSDGDDDAIEKLDSIFSTDVISGTTVDCKSTPLTKTDTDDNTSDETITKASKEDAQSEEMYNDEAKIVEPKQITFNYSPLLQRGYKKIDLFNNISISRAALQKSRLVVDENGSYNDDTCDTSLDMSQKSGMTNNDVVKFLQLEDNQSISEQSLNKYSPPKYMHETKGIVIPKHLEDVPDGVIELMSDLVKPINNNGCLALENLMVDKDIPTNPSTQRTQILGNLVTSSQLDLESESCSSPERYFKDNLNSLNSTVTSNMSESGSLRSPINFPGTVSGFNYPELKTRLLCTRATVEQSSHADMLVFDHLNPLNNVLLRPIKNLEAHKYNPMKSDEANCPSLGTLYNQAKRDDTSKNVEVQTVTIKQHQFGPQLNKPQEEIQIINLLRSHSINKEELAAESDNITKLTEVQNRFRSNSNGYITKGKKQMCSPSTDKRRQQQSSVEVTPKPIAKMQQISSGPKVQIKMPLELLATGESSSSSTSVNELSRNTMPKKDDKKNADRKAHSSKTRDMKSLKSKATKSGNTIIGRKFKAESTGLDTGTKHKTIFKKRLLDHINLKPNGNSERFIAFSQSDMSFASTNNINPMTDILSTSSTNCQSSHQCMMQGMPPQGNWHPEPPPSGMLVFDYLNSLNNVLLPPINNSEPHKYNPIKSNEKPRESKKRTSKNGSGFKSNHYTDINFRQASTRNFEVRTVTITPEKNQRRKRRLSLASLMKEAVETENVSKSSEVSLQDRFSSNSNANLPRNKKRIYKSTDKHRQQQTTVEMTPKSITKMQKTSGNPKFQIKVPVELKKTDKAFANMEPVKNDKKTTNHSTTTADAHTSKTRDKGLPKTKATKPGQNIAVQQSIIDDIIADYTDFDTGYEKYNNNGYEKTFLDDINSILNPESFTEFSHSDVYFAHNTNLKPLKDIYSTSNTSCQSPSQSTMQVMHPKVHLNRELICATRRSQYDSGVNVVAKIDMLPFMGSHECEWGSSSTDMWSFRLLHGRLKLTVRLAHRLDNAIRTRVRGDTPVLNIAVEALQYDSEDVVATMCIRFALQTMHHMVLSALSTKCYANDIPPLLQRLAAVVRVALRWARAIADAKLRLAYTLDSDGNVSLKVANIPLRSIWEVRMRIELVLDSAQAVPWPRASNVRVLPVVSDVVVPDEDVRRALEHIPKDWAHAPSTIW